MKKLVLSAILCTGLLVISEKAQAQSTFSLGPVVGFGHSGISNASSDNAVFKPSVQAGLTMIFSNQSNLGFGADILYSLEGAKREAGGNTFDYSLSYLRIPLRVSYFFSDPNSSFRPKVSVGPSFGFLMGAKSEIKNDLGSFSSSNKDGLNSVDIGLNVAVGFNYALATKMWLNAELGYTQGFVDVIDAGSDSNLNNNLGLKVGLAFGL